MRFRSFAFTSVFLALGAACLASAADGPYQLLQRQKVGGDGGFDYVYADSAGRKLYVARGGNRSGVKPRVVVYDLDSLKELGSIAETQAHGAVVDSQSNHGFASSKPIAMFDAGTFAPVKKITVDGNPDGLLQDDFNQRVYVFSHSAPNVTVIDAKDGSVLGTIDLGAAPEQAVADGKGKVFVDLEDKGAVAVIDAASMKVTNTYSLNGKGAGNAGLAIDKESGVLFVACREPQVMVMISAADGSYLADLPIGRGCDGAVFNPDTKECFSSQGDGTLTVIKESDPKTFTVEQTVKTMPGAKTCTLDTKTGHLLLVTAEYGPAPAGARRGPLVPDSFSILAIGK